MKERIMMSEIDVTNYPQWCDKDKINFNDWFNPLLAGHMLEYAYIQKHGHWREGFIPDNIEMENNWQVTLLARMAKYWTQFVTTDLTSISVLNNMRTMERL